MRRWFFVLTLITAALFFISVPPEGLGGSGFWALRREGIFLSGILAYSMMAAIMLLAIRPLWLEKMLGGLDRSYLLHKWLGIGSATLVFGHWMIEIVPKSMVKAGWLARPVKGGQNVESLFYFLEHAAKEVGEILGYLCIALVIIALVKLIPYHWFRRLHKVFPIVFLVVTFHSVVLMPDALWPTVIGVWIGICALIGSAASLLALLGYTGKNRTYDGKIDGMIRFDDSIMEIECRLDGEGMHHHAGQFVFLKIPGMKDAHPFTIASGGDDPNRLIFCIKVLGDDTRRMMKTLHEGARVQVEGPYGAFDFKDNRSKQIWVGAGIGATPFISRLESMLKRDVHDPEEAQNIHFFYCAPKQSPLTGRIRQLCLKAGVKLHLVDGRYEGKLDLEKIRLTGADLARSSLWFCGPGHFGDALEKSWAAIGQAKKNFHREIFAMR